jgi:flagellar hook-associated protein 1 FlgK
MFNMLSIGKKAVSASEKQLEVTAHNISNANTPGFSRQRVVQTNADPISSANLTLGTGVDVIRIERMRDIFLDQEFRKLNGNTGFWDTMARHLTQLEKNVLETTEHGISSAINGFFNSWESLANNPFSTIHRMDVVESAQVMTERFQDLYRSIEAQKNDVKLNMKTSVDRINQIADDLANLTHIISLHKTTGNPINDLLDKYDLLIDELSSYGNVQIHHRENGTTSIYLGSDELVRNSHVHRLNVVENVNLATGEQQFFIAWGNSHREIAGLHSGSLKALGDLKDVILPSYLQKLDELAVDIVKQVNLIHTQGFTDTVPPQTGTFFFDPNVTGVMDFRLSNAVASDPSFIAASMTGASGDNQIALMMTDLRLAKVFNDQTLTESFADLVFTIGNDVRFSRSSADRSQMISQQADNFRDSVKGVSVNEETANLIRFQQAYQAAAKIISVADDMMRTIIGLVR